MKNNLDKNLINQFDKKINWIEIQNTFKIKFGNEIYESWLKKIDLVDEFSNYILLSVQTRFIRDWITSRYLDQILKILKEKKKEIIRVEFTILNKNSSINNLNNTTINKEISENISFIKDSYLQYNRIDLNKRFDNFLPS